MFSRQLAGLIAGATLSCSALAGDVGVSISVGQPGFYGRLDIGGYPPPALIYPQPVIIAPAPAYAPVVYLRVPPGHRKHWARYCHHYGACAQPVYFVRHDWYLREYVPHYHRHHHHRHHEYTAHADHRDHGHRFERRGSHADERGRGPGKGHGRGHGHGKDRD